MTKKHMFKYSVFSSSKKLFTCLITIAFYSTCFALSGSGTAGDPYVIASVADFDVFANPANAATYWASGIYTKLACDIDLQGTYATAVIAPDTDNTNAQTFDGIAFAGEFNGNDYKITNLTIDSAGVKNSYLGLFGQIAAEGQVTNLGIENVTVTSNGGGEATYYIGGLCGNNLGTVTNCYTTGSVAGSYTGYIGGLAGQNSAGLITSCYSNVSVSTGEGSGFIGGLAGVNVEADINDCYATGSVTATYNTDWLGGLVGINIVMTGGEFSTVSNCYATGSVANGNASSNVGGLAGGNSGAGSSVIDCFWDIETGGPDNSIGTGKTTAQMRDMATFVDAGWDFVGETDNGIEDYWRQPYQVGYPILYWQRDIPGDFTGSYGVNFLDFSIFANDWLTVPNWADPEQAAKLIASDTAVGDYFGGSVTIDGDVAIVGASGDDDGGFQTGSVYLFDVTTGTQLAKLTASDAAMDDHFGGSVAINGNVVIIGAVGDYNGSASGSAYLFDVTTGTQLAKLTASDAAANDNFGRSVAINGNVAIVGAVGNDDGGSNSGSAYLFDVTTGTQLAKLTASDASADDWFGGSVAINGNVAIVGASGDDDSGERSGSAYLFDATTGTQLAKLTASDAAAEDYFGYSVAIDGNIAIIGARLDDGSGVNSGSAYLFDVTTCTQLFKLTASDAAADDCFGGSVAIDGNVAIVGAFGDDDGGSGSGSAYLFDVTTGTQLAKLTASDTAAGDRFGTSVAIDGNIAIVGASGDEDGGSNSGSAYLFKKTVSSATNLNKSGSVDLEDLKIFAEHWLVGSIDTPSSDTPVKFFSEELNSDPGWSTEGEWQFGIPLGQGGTYGNPDPTSGYTGNNVYGINLGGDCSSTGGVEIVRYLTSSAVDCTGYNDVKLKYARWMNMPEPMIAPVSVEVSNDNLNWNPVWINDAGANYKGMILDSDWVAVEHDISQYADNQSTVYIRWGYSVYSDLYPESGWNIDDVQLWGSHDATAFVADYNGSSPTIDGVLSGGEWGSSYTVTMDRVDGGGQHDINLYFQNDGTSLFIGIDSQWGSGWDVVWDCYIDGDYSRTVNGSLSQPYTDINICQQSPTGWFGYRAYRTLPDIGGVRVGYDSGADSASSGSTNVSYEFRIPLADLDVITGDSIGLLITHGYDGNPEHLYQLSLAGSLATPENWATLQIVP